MKVGKNWCHYNHNLLDSIPFSISYALRAFNTPVTSGGKSTRKPGTRKPGTRKPGTLSAVEKWVGGKLNMDFLHFLPEFLTYLRFLQSGAYARVLQNYKIIKYGKKLHKNSTKMKKSFVQLAFNPFCE